jgi:hypothetical protein
MASFLGGGKRDASWPDVGRNWQLLQFSSGHGAPESFEKFLSGHRESVGHLYSASNEGKLIEGARKAYHSYLEYRARFNGCFKVRERVQVIRESAIAILLSREWTGSPADHSDMELVLTFESDGLFSRTGSYYCEAYTFGTIDVGLGSFEHLVGQEKPGKSRVSHLQGIYRVHFDALPEVRSVRLSKLRGHGDDSAEFTCLR